MPPSLKQDGFTLLELVIAMGLFASGLLGLTLLTSCLMANNMTARHHAVATQLAQNKIEMLRQNAYSGIVDGTEPKVDASGSSGSGVFSRAVTVEENEDPAFKQVTVTVSWRLKGEHRVVLSSIVAAP
jgi:prepilin-type N-terminal cleavage/methylation domain-containing protein